MIYTANCIERLHKDFRRVLKARNSMPEEDSVITYRATLHTRLEKVQTC